MYADTILRCYSYMVKCVHHQYLYLNVVVVLQVYLFMFAAISIHAKLFFELGRPSC